MALQHPLVKHTYEFAAEPVHSSNLNDIQDAVVELQEQWTDPDSIADEYSSSSTYKLGQLCIYNNTLYRCTTAITTAGAWDSSKWTLTTIADEIERIGFHDIIPVTLSGITALPKTFSVPGITADHKLIQEGDAYVSPRSSMAGEWTLETSANQIRVLGTFSGSTSTTIIATMGIPNKTVTGVAQ